MGFLDRILGRNQVSEKSGVAMVKELGTFSVWGGDAYSSDVYRAGVDAIARNCGKLKGTHIIKNADHTQKEGDCKLNRLLQVRPNPYMNAYDFIYKMVTHYYIHNNAFALIDRDDRGNPIGFYPITTNNVEFLSDSVGRLYCRFTMNTGKVATFDYRDVIHLRRAFNTSDLLGDDNSAIYPTLELAHVQNEGIISGIKAGASIRGLLRFTQIMAPEKLKAEKEAFIADYLTMSNDGGVIAVDQKAEYIPLENKPVLLNAEQSKAIQDKVYNYLGISPQIVDSSYSEDQFSAFYESVIEPIALALGLEFTSKLFNDRAQAYGNAVMFESGRLQFTSNKTKVELIKEIMPLGLLSVNQALEILNLPSVPDGDRRLQSLNFIDQADASKYQLGKVSLNHMDNRLKEDE